MVAYFYGMFLSLQMLTSMALGVPPGDRDLKLSAIAPADPIAYVTWASMAKPDANGDNPTEKLLAEPQVQVMVQGVVKEILAAIERSGGGNPPDKLMAKELPPLILDALTSPTAIYLGTLEIGDGGASGEGAIISRLGRDRMASAKQSMDNFEAIWLKEMRGQPTVDLKIGSATLHIVPTPQGVPQVAWGVVADEYMVVTVGPNEAQRIVPILEGTAKPAGAVGPKWLADLRGAAHIEREGSIAYVNAARILVMAKSLGGPEAARVLSAIGVDNLQTYGTVAGLDANGFVSKAFVNFDGRPVGVFGLLGDKPLTVEDLKRIPADSTLAIAGHFDSRAIFNEIRERLGKIDVNSQQDFDLGIKRFEDAVGFSVEKDVLASLGDLVTIHNSPAQGGLVITGATAVVDVKDRARLSAANEKLVAAIEKEAQDRDARDAANEWHRRRGIYVKEIEYAGQKIYFLNAIGEDWVAAPAWCLTEDKLIVSLYPQMIKSMLDAKGRGEAKAGEGFADTSRVKQLFDGGRAPVFAGCLNMQALFQTGYPLLHGAATAACGEMQRDGMNIDVSMLPSMNAIVPHLGMDTTAVYRTPTGLMAENHSVIPSAPAGIAAQSTLFALGWLVGARPVRINESVAPVMIAPAQPDPAPADGPNPVMPEPEPVGPPVGPLPPNH